MTTAKLSSHALQDARSGSEDDGHMPSSSRLSDVELTLHFDIAGFRLSLPLLPGAQPASSAAAGRAAERAAGVAATAAAAAAEHRPEVLQLQSLLLERDPGILSRLAASGEAPDEPFFTRWLIARRGSVARAAADIAAHAAWRAEFFGGGGGGAAAVLEGLLRQQGSAHSGGQRKVFLQGLCASGEALVVLKAGQHALTAQDLPDTLRLICCAMDCAAAAADLAVNPLGRVVCLFDLAGMSARSLDPKALSAIFSVLQDHYPERLARLYFANAPLVFWGVWRLVSPWVDPATRGKVVFLSGRAAAAALRQAVPEGVLPAEYGGAAELVPLEQAVAARRAAARGFGGGGAGGGGPPGGPGGGGAGRPAPGRGGWRARLAGARRGLGAVRGRAGAGVRGAGRALRRAAEAAAAAAGGAARRLRATRKVSQAKGLLRQLLVPELLLAVLRQAGYALRLAHESAVRRIKSE